MNIIYNFNSFLASSKPSSNAAYLDTFKDFVNELIIHTLIVLFLRWPGVFVSRYGALCPAPYRHVSQCEIMI
jgi:hypothetical protein